MNRIEFDGIIIEFGSPFGLTDADTELLAIIGKHLQDSEIETCYFGMPHWERGYQACWYEGKWYMEN